jgi:hypothetical protein
MSSNTHRPRLLRGSTAAVLFLAAVSGAAVTSHVTAQRVDSVTPNGQHRFFADDPIWLDEDNRDIPPVAPFDLSKSYEFVNETFGESVRSRGRALNVNTLGEVPDSSWFTNRLGRHDMTIEQIVRGPNTNDGPAPGTWWVTGRPDSGITPKFTIRDGRGDKYLVKLDPADYPELPSSVEVIATKIFHAIGYHVPEDFVVTFDPAMLDVAPGATIRTDTGSRRSIARGDVEQWLRNTPRTADGRIRALASRYVPGTVVGQFRYTGTRSDDPNDIYPHERRRELRGLRVFAAWLNHDDARSINSIDTYVEQDGRRFVRHYLQDFGSVLGSGSTSAQQPRGGYEYLIDGGRSARGLLSFGLWNRGWTSVEYPRVASLGNIEADYFEPWKWKTEYPQPAFDQMDAGDAFWAASIAARFSDEMLRAIVAAGELSDPEASRMLTDVLIRRRDKVVSYWIAQTNPLDTFAVGPAGRRAEMTFENAAIRIGIAEPGARYRVAWLALDNVTGATRAVGNDETTDMRAAVPAAAWGPADTAGYRYAVAVVRTTHRDFPQWEQPVHVTLRDRRGVLDVVGVERPAAAAPRADVPSVASR